ncbi:MAG: sensor histidine kinase, partial [Acetobacteraceae bacterium]
MSRLIDDLLALSRIEANEHQPPAQRIDLAALLARARASFEPRLPAAGPRLALHLAGPLPQVAADADQIMQVLQNLLENALKYGAEGGEIRLSAEPVVAGGAQWPGRAGVVFAVADRGPGIAPEHLPRLTERFYRVDKGRSRAMGGTGLGLAIVKHIISRHRGLLRIESEEGQGTVVRVFLPAA